MKKPLTKQRIVRRSKQLKLINLGICKDTYILGKTRGCYWKICKLYFEKANLNFKNLNVV